MVHLFALRRFAHALPTTLILCGLAACSIDRAGLRVDEDAAVRDGNVADAADMSGPPVDGGCTGRELQCGGECVDPLSDPRHCGSCDACPARAGATSTCTDGACGFACETGFTDCDGDADNGCEANTVSDPLTCGGCGRPCPARFGTTPRCTDSACMYDCGGGLSDCDGSEANGCETNTTSDPLHCGSCAPCPAVAGATSGCSARACTYACAADFRDCDGAPANGCEIDVRSSPTHCGGCGTICAPAANASASCTARVCGFSCTAPFGDCDGLSSNGCERNTQTDIANCGSCGILCPGRANAMTTCGTTGCGFSCATGFGNCDALPATGCEVALATTAAHCGMCGNACATGRSCVGSACQGWTSVSPTAAPSARTSHVAVWTGTEMIVWGGENGAAFLGDGGRYNPTTNAWTAMSAAGAPSARRSHTAVWTGTEMIVWGGYGATSWVNTGARYNPTTNAWTAMSTAGAPGARSRHAAVWTGSRMIVWGGWTNGGGGDAGDGASYDPATNTWTALSNTNAPSDRRWHTGIAAGTRMVAWGGETGGGGAIGDGKRYDFPGGVWTDLSTSGDPPGRARHSSVWTGTYLLVWGGDDGDSNGVFGTPRVDGGRYDPAADTWAATAGAALAARARHTAVWSGTRMLVWGGGASTTTAFGDGAAYDPTGTGSWATLSATGAPSARQGHTAVWTGTEMIVWGGSSATGAVFADGARLIP